MKWHHCRVPIDLDTVLICVPKTHNSDTLVALDSVTYMGTRPLNKGTNRPITLCTVKLFIQLMYNKNDHLAKWSIFCQIFDVFFRLYNPFAPLDPRRPLHMLCICIATFNCPKGILGLGGQSI